MTIEKETEKRKGIVLEKFTQYFEQVEKMIEMLGYRTTIEDGKIKVSDLQGNLFGNMGDFSFYTENGSQMKIDTPKGTLRYIYIQDNESEYRNAVILGSRRKTDYSDLESIRIEQKGDDKDSNKGIVAMIKDRKENKEVRFAIEGEFVAAKIGPPYEKDGKLRSVIIKGTHSFTSGERDSAGNRMDLEVKRKGKLEAEQYKKGEKGPNKTGTYRGIGLVKKLITSKKTKILIEDVLNEFDAMMPGIKNFIESNYEQMSQFKEPQKRSKRLQKFLKNYEISSATPSPERTQGDSER